MDSRDTGSDPSRKLPEENEAARQYMVNNDAYAKRPSWGALVIQPKSLGIAIAFYWELQEMDFLEKSSFT